MDSTQLTQREETAFLLGFAASMWKRTWRCMYLYLEKSLKECEEEKAEKTDKMETRDKPKTKRIKTLCPELLMRCLKYNLIAPTGFYAEVQTNLEKVFRQGFLLPSEQATESVKRAIKLFCLAYDYIKYSDIVTPDYYKFTYDFACTICQDSPEYEDQEVSDILKNISSDFCELVDSWDINVDLFDLFLPEPLTLIQSKFIQMLSFTLNDAK